MALLKKGRVLESSVTGERYEILGSLGEPGGFGEAYLADLLRRRGVPRQVCVKATLDQTSWHREAYFGELLHTQKRVIQIYDSFPVARQSSGRNQPIFCLVSELAELGTVSDFLEKRGRGLSPNQAKAQVLALLKVLNLLHGGSATHRDLTPNNVLVCNGPILKLADFGIARHGLLNKRATVTALNEWFAPTDFAGHPSDDVYFMGQLLAMLIKGEAWCRLDLKDLKDLPCDDLLQSVIKKSIGPRSTRFADAWEMLEALEGKTADSQPSIRTLKNKSLIFTGPLSIKRADAETLALQAGARIASKVNKSLDVIVLGGRSPHYQKGHKGSKLAEVDRLNRAGATIRKIGESQFRQLVRHASIK